MRARQPFEGIQSFIGDNFETMQVHNGKCCVSNIECGLCGMEAETLENLETHLASCEVYECEECEIRHTKLSDIKVHIEEDHSKDKNFFLIIATPSP